MTLIRLEDVRGARGNRVLQLGLPFSRRDARAFLHGEQFEDASNDAHQLHSLSSSISLTASPWSMLGATVTQETRGFLVGEVHGELFERQDARFRADASMLAGVRAR